jgi:hypothetical protein
VKKKAALAVVKKLGFKVRKGKENFAKFHHNGLLILTTAVPKGRGDMYVSNQFRLQLRLSREQLDLAVRCPFGPGEYLAHLEKTGLLD